MWYAVRFLETGIFLSHAIMVLGRVFCELCLKMRKCPFCVFKPQDAKRLYVSYTDDNREADDEVERFLSETYMYVQSNNPPAFCTHGSDRGRMGVILLQTHDQLVAELNTCRELTKKLDEQSANMTSAVEMARLRKEQMLTSRDEMAHHLNGLKKLVTEREQEVSSG